MEIKDKLIIHFYTDESVNGRGFSATWKREQLSQESGSFSSPNYPKRYGNNELISKQLFGPKGSQIEITFVDFNTERCCDFLWVIDGNGSLLGVSKIIIENIAF